MKATLKKHKAPLAVGLVAVLALVAYFNRHQLKSLFSKKAPTTPVPNNSTTNNISTQAVDRNTLLKKGDRGAMVKELQTRLNIKNSTTQNPLAPLQLDGVFGAKTEAMLLRLTGKSSLSVHQLENTPTLPDPTSGGAYQYTWN